jgi:hypothetical protein
LLFRPGNDGSRRVTRPACVVALVLLGLVQVHAGRAERVRSQRPPGTWCGGSPWRLMTLSDAQRGRVNFAPIDTSISQISQLGSPSTIGLSRSTDFQRHRWRLEAVVDRYRVASNGEIVLILYSIPTAQYMNVYLPNPDCLGSSARDRTGMIAARKEFTSHCPPATADWQLLGVSVEVAGIGYWNASRATRGALPNGAELRPLTNLRIVSGCGVP